MESSRVPAGRRRALDLVAWASDVVEVSMTAEEEPAATERAVFALGSFWGAEAEFRYRQGVVDTRVGYMGGSVDDPTPEMVAAGGATGHAEVVEITFEPETVSYEQLLE